MTLCACELNLTDVNNILLIIFVVRNLFNLIDHATSETQYSHNTLKTIFKITCLAIYFMICTWLYEILDAIVYFVFCKYASSVIFVMLSYKIFDWIVVEICQRELNKRTHIRNSTSEIDTVNQNPEPAAGPSSFESLEINPYPLNSQPPAEGTSHEDRRLPFHGLTPHHNHIVVVDDLDAISEDGRHPPSENNSLGFGDGISNINGAVNEDEESEEDGPIAYRLRSKSPKRKKKKQVVFHKPKPRR
ncbi:hypothetical protein JTE90_011183 [Oedothorax gibbosus]|uniref:Uncharacterized protein n=1 Tax=Oedothorax gibbosus TaxID=931172 RepID=A0AAV6VWY5_9ARAC|nr:hypothetical protein JTE90_011183 [Oedothorax gibbosus]